MVDINPIQTKQHLEVLSAEELVTIRSSTLQTLEELAQIGSTLANTKLMRKGYLFQQKLISKPLTTHPTKECACDTQKVKLA